MLSLTYILASHSTEVKQEEESGSAAKKSKLDPVRELGTSGVSSTSKTMKGKDVRNVMFNYKHATSAPPFLHVDYACRSGIVKDREAPFSLNYAHLKNYLKRRSSVGTCCLIVICKCRVNFQLQFDTVLMKIFCKLNTPEYTAQILMFHLSKCSRFQKNLIKTSKT